MINDDVENDMNPAGVLSPNHLGGVGEGVPSGQSGLQCRWLRRFKSSHTSDLETGTVALSFQFSVRMVS